MKMTIETITPEMARKYLAKSRGNRTLNARRVSMYARDMEAGRWELNHQGIAFFVDGSPADGHHRLEACVLADTAFKTLVFRDVTSVASCDQGYIRSAADVAMIHDLFPGLDAALLKTIFGAAGFMVRHCGQIHQPSTGEKNKVVAFYTAEFDAIVRGAWPHRKQPWISTAGPIVAGLAIHRKHGKGDNDELLQQWFSGVGIDAGGPALLLREYIAQLKTRSSRRGDGSTTRCYKVLRICEAFDARQKIGKLQAPKSDRGFDRMIRHWIGDRHAWRLTLGLHAVIADGRQRKPVAQHYGKPLGARGSGSADDRQVALLLNQQAAVVGAMKN